jgi:acetyl-CoA carboxylase biotin carboxyl carrier protein
MKFDLDYIEKLVNLVTKSELTELTLEDTDKVIVIKKENTVITEQIAAPRIIQAAALPAGFTTDTSVVSAPQTDVNEPEGTPITSPMVGTFYSSPSPGAKPFVETGSVISTGQIVCIIEAMKLMNEIESEVSGKITKICVTDGQPVEYGQILMYVA